MESSGADTGASLWLVAQPNGRYPKVMRAVSARGAILGRLKDDEDVVYDGIWAAWRLGNFPEQFEVDGLDGTAAITREIGRPHV